ncbi:hypothetical protein CS0771_56290 [Catellatospora sp. IY07-71]|uniref:CG0192-related protein n=1 Tax=Catellatospora sp. IY07-71 TaxID=2728827 RepID=UPI001BB3FC86|nr:hypothetical protein [Catellatospora sp. IY07-71]BCJ76085.1 hypothetical protein CS0771_56290 [Catellatospora sp. IY07-71]
MALLHHADISPTKLELLAAWLPGRTWFSGDAAAVERVAACRFDDPAGEVGIEMMMVRAGDGPVLHVPLTYRGAPLAGGEAFLIGTTEHSVLGKRWVYDACGDPVYVSALARAVLTGGTQAEEYFEVDGQKQVREPAMTVTGSGSHEQALVLDVLRKVTDGDPTVVTADGVELSVVRAVGTRTPSGDEALTANWPGLSAPVVMATVNLG